MQMLKWSMLIVLVGYLGCANDKEAPPSAPGTTDTTGTPSTTGTSDTLVLTKDGDNWIRVESRAYQWQAHSGDQTAVLRETNGGYDLRVNGKTYPVKPKEDGFKIYDSEQRVILKCKRYPDKLKVSQSEEDPRAWSIRPKTGESTGYKIKRGESEIGKIGYYPEQQQVKAKDLEDGVLCRAACTHLSHVPTVAFMSDLSLPKQLMVSVILTVMEP